MVSTVKRVLLLDDESDQDDDEDDPTPRWNSGESDASDSPSESEDDVTWGKKKKKKAPFNPPKSKMRTAFFLPEKGNKSKGTGKSRGSPKKKKKRVDEEEVDRAWNVSNPAARRHNNTLSPYFVDNENKECKKRKLDLSVFKKPTVKKLKLKL